MTHDAFDTSVRLPSHISPPYRARNWHNACLRATTGLPPWEGSEGQVQFDTTAACLTFSIRWSQGLANLEGISASLGAVGIAVNQGEPFPEGMLGVACWSNFSMRVRAVNNYFPTGNWAWTIWLNGSPVPGLVMQTFATKRGSGAGQTENWCLTPPLLAPVHLRGGDRLDVELYTLETVVATPAVVQLAGWMYPLQVAGDAGSIRQTQADPRARHPLGG